MTSPEICHEQIPLSPPLLKSAHPRHHPISHILIFFLGVARYKHTPALSATAEALSVITDRLLTLIPIRIVGMSDMK
jgi:hypothetical protein